MRACSGATLALLLGSLFAPPPVRACGGLFCNRAMPMMPSQVVDQAGEDIVYIVEDDGGLTMIVRILYQGSSENFAWILPVPIAPRRIELGPQSLFDQLAAATGPQFSLGSRTDGTCRAPPSCDFPGGGCGLGCALSAASERGATADGGAFAPRADAGVLVVSEGAVGAYETAILSGGTAEELHQWLTDHSYDLPRASIPLIAEYVAARQLFVALRLRSSASTDAIQPIALRLETERPCLPIRLTAIATVPDLPIRAYFLGSAPFAPTNYSMIDPPLSPSVFQVATPWPRAWSEAIDEAGGHAWIRDYAGDPPPVSLRVPSLDALRRAGPQEFFSRAISVSQYPREALVAITPDFVTLEGAMDIASWIDACARGSCATPARWDPDGLVDALHAQVRDPRARFAAAFERQSWLTRLYTSLDAPEMTLDPEFSAPTLGSARRATRIARRS